MPNQATARARESDIVSRLASFFPEATPVRIPIKLTATPAMARQRQWKWRSRCRRPQNKTVFFQDTVIEFGTPHEVLFVVDRPLEFADSVLVESKDGSLHAEGSVVAVQYKPEWTVVAVRFLKPVPNWIVKS